MTSISFSGHGMWVLTVMSYDVLAHGPFVFNNHYRAREYAEKEFGVPQNGWIGRRGEPSQWYGEDREGNVVEIIKAEYNPL